MRAPSARYMETIMTSSYIRHEDFTRPSVFRPSSVTLRLPPLISEMGWTGELWSKTKFLILENKEDSIFYLFFRHKKIFFRNLRFLKKSDFFEIFRNFFRFSDFFRFFDIFQFFLVFNDFLG